MDKVPENGVHAEYKGYIVILEFA